MQQLSVSTQSAYEISNLKNSLIVITIKLFFYFLIIGIIA